MCRTLVLYQYFITKSILIFIFSLFFFQELDVLTLGSNDQEQLIAERNKRTIGLLRELFPDLTKVSE